MDDKYRLITSTSKAYGLKAYYKEGKYYEEKIKKDDKYKDLKELLSK